MLRLGILNTGFGDTETYVETCCEGCLGALGLWGGNPKP